MMGGSGGAGADPFVALLGLVGDKAGTEKRIKELQAATEANEASAIELQNLRTDIAKREREVSKRENETQTIAKVLEERETAVIKSEDRIASRMKALDEEKANLGADLEERARKLDLAASSLAAQQREYETDQALLQTRANQLDEREAGIKEREDGIQMQEAELEEQRAALEEKQNKLRELLG